MPNWLVPTLKWGGIAVAIVFAIALGVTGQQDAPAEGAEEVASTAPVALYWVLLIAGVVAGIVGFWLGGKQKASS